MKSLFFSSFGIFVAAGYFQLSEAATLGFHQLFVYQTSFSQHVRCFDDRCCGLKMLGTGLSLQVKPRWRLFITGMSQGDYRKGRESSEDGIYEERSLRSANPDLELGSPFGVLDVNEEMNQLDQRLMAAIEADSSDLRESVQVEGGSLSDQSEDYSELNKPRKVCSASSADHSPCVVSWHSTVT